MDYIVTRYLRAGPDGRKSAKYQGDMFCKHIENVQHNDEDTRKDELFSEVCLQILQERVHGVATGIL